MKKKNELKKTGLTEKKGRWGWVFIAPWLVGFVCFFAVPLLNSIYYTFTKINNKFNKTSGINLLISTSLDLTISIKYTTNKPYIPPDIPIHSSLSANIPWVKEPQIIEETKIIK